MRVYENYAGLHNTFEATERSSRVCARINLQSDPQATALVFKNVALKWALRL
jgi:hypothetical protein